MSENTEVRYARQDNLVRLKLQNLTNHELREVLVGLWSRLDEDDRIDHINELVHYQVDRKAFLSPVASAIRDGEMGESTIDVDQLKREEQQS